MYLRDFGNAGRILNEILPGPSVFPLVCVLLTNYLTYFTSRIFTSHLKHYSLETALDRRIPFCTAFIWIYILSYLVWALGFLLTGWQEREKADELFAAEMAAKLLTLLFFVLLPTFIDRPYPEGNGLSERVTRLIFDLDAPDNLFPSIHCLESWFCFRVCTRLKNRNPVLEGGMFVAALLVFASTVLLKQHVVLDIAGGILVVEAGLLAARKWKLGRGFARLREKVGLVPW